MRLSSVANVFKASYKRLDELHSDVRSLKAERELGRWRLLGLVLGSFPLRLLWTRNLSSEVWSCLRTMWPIVKHREPWNPVFTVGFSVFDVPEGEKPMNANGALSCFNIGQEHAAACHELHNRGYLEEHLVRGRLYTHLSDSGPTLHIPERLAVGRVQPAYRRSTFTGERARANVYHHFQGQCVNVRRGCSLYGATPLAGGSGPGLWLSSKWRGTGCDEWRPYERLPLSGASAHFVSQDFGLTHHWGSWPRRTVRTPALTCSEVRRRASSVWVAEGERQALR